MSDSDSYAVVMTTCKTKREAERIAMRLVEDRAAACVNLIEKVTSIYQWQGKIEKSTEVLCVIKTRRAHVDRVEGTIRGFSSYDCPEVVVLPITEGAAEYLQWITDVTSPAP